MTNSIIPLTNKPKLISLQMSASCKISDDAIGFLCFLLDDKEYGVNLNLIYQVVKPPLITPIPRTEPHFLGIVSIRGAVVTLVDFRQLMGLPKTGISKTKRILVIETEDEQIGLLVDSVTQVRHAKLTELEKKPLLRDTESTDFVVCVVKPSVNNPILIIDLDSLLQEKLR